MDKFVKDRFLDKDWVEKITNTHSNKKDPNNMTTTGQVLREIAQMESFNNYMAVQLKKSEDRQTVILATLLSTILDKGKENE